jgi:hypothetical protein
MWTPAKFSPLRSAVAADVDDPLQLFGADLLAWYKADTEVFSDAGTTPAVDTNTVQQWNDQSGNDFHLLQASAGSRPVFNTAGFNGLQGITFSGDFLQIAAETLEIGGAEFSAFCVMKIGSGTNNNGRIISLFGTTAGNDFSAPVMDFDTQTATPSIRVFRGAAVGESTIVYDTNYRLGTIADGADQNTYLNNVAGTSGSISTAFETTVLLTIGADDVGGQTVAGTYAEIVLVSKALTLGERTSLDDYFVDKWNL